MALELALYEAFVDQEVLAAINHGASEFWDLVKALPGIYPTEVRNALGRLRLPDRVVTIPHVRFEESANSCDACPGSLELPAAHPLTCDWRFSKETATLLLDLALNLADPSRSVILLGAPTVYALAAHKEIPRTVRARGSESLPHGPSPTVAAARSDSSVRPITRSATTGSRDP